MLTHTKQPVNIALSLTAVGHNLSKESKIMKILKPIKRLHKTRYEIKIGPCYIGLHFWKFSMYIPRAKSKRIQSDNKVAINAATAKGAL